MINDSGRAIVGTNQGIMKAKDFRINTIMSKIWNIARFNAITGAPWESTPGRSGDYSIKPNTDIPETGPIRTPARGI